MLKYTRNLGASTVVVSWWDYGYWLTVLGNVTTLCDNATINGTQIENVGFTFIANQTLALKMLKTYKAQYILVFATMSTDGALAGYGDEGKWAWMARISGKGKERLISEGYMDPNSAWSDSLDDVQNFGNYTLGFNATDANKDGDYQDEGEITANPRGQATTIFQLMYYARNRWLEIHQNATAPAELTYFKEAFIAGLSLKPDDAYGKLVPLVALYEIKYPTP
jgi:asparagine N-glycosylation enzyme membrane subunit Stt3